MTKAVPMAGKSKLTLVSDGNYWQGLYVDGELYCEGHAVTPDQVAAALGHELTYQYTDAEWLQERGTLPRKLANVP